MRSLERFCVRLSKKRQLGGENRQVVRESPVVCRQYGEALIRQDWETGLRGPAGHVGRQPQERPPTILPSPSWRSVKRGCPNRAKAQPII